MRIRRPLLNLAGILLISLAPMVAMAESHALKCTSRADQQRTEASDIDLVLDLDHMLLTWGTAKYKVTQVTTKYITALYAADGQDNRSVGGEIFVLDRVTGEFKRAAVAMICTVPAGSSVDPEQYCKDRMNLDAFTYSGRCVRPLL